MTFTMMVTIDCLADFFPVGLKPFGTLPNTDLCEKANPFPSVRP